MFKIKFETKTKELIKQKLHLSEENEYEIILCENIQDAERDKVNVIFSLDQLDFVEECIQFKKALNKIQINCKSERGEERVSLNDIYSIESFGNEITANLNKKKLQVSSKLYKIEDELFEYGFVRISKSMIVNIGKVEAVQNGFNGKLNITLDNRIVLEVNRSFVKEFKAYLERR